ncbi:unnamed protein product [Mytilus edulis]|uniref:Uncharacterized protein n=1 Tax=Mytilus edulis TaxID=6550 RepID=A0A8S3T0M1_MYTED|nr:unnamed protein product [Mytilus edulis]
MFCSGLGRQERTGTGRLPETKNKDILTVISPDKPTDNLATLHGGQDKTDHEQPTDNLAMLHCGQDKRETNMVSDTENILTIIPFDQTSRDQLMNDACQTRQKVDAGNISDKECLGNVCEIKDILTNCSDYFIFFQNYRRYTDLWMTKFLIKFRRIVDFHIIFDVSGYA